MFRTFRPLLTMLVIGTALLSATAPHAFADAGFLAPRETALVAGSNTQQVSAAWPLGAFAADGTLLLAAAGDPTSGYFSQVRDSRHAAASTASSSFVTSDAQCPSCDYVSIHQNAAGDAVMSYAVGYEIFVKRRYAGGPWGSAEQLDSDEFEGTHAFTNPVHVTERDENGNARFLVTYHEYTAGPQLTIAAVATGDGDFSRQLIGRADATSSVVRIEPDHNGNPVVLFMQEEPAGERHFDMRRMGADETLGAPLQINLPGSTIGSTSDADIAFAPDGSMMATWRDVTNPGPWGEVRPVARHLQSDGVTWSTPTQNVRLTELQNPESMNVTALPDGSFSFDFVIWDYPNLNGHGFTRPAHVEWTEEDGYEEIQYLAEASDVYSGQQLVADVTGDGTLIVLWNGTRYRDGVHDPTARVWAAVREPGAEEFLADDVISGDVAVEKPLQLVVDRRGNDAAVLIGRRVTFAATSMTSLDVIPYDGEGPRPSAVTVAAAATAGVATTFTASPTDTWSAVSGFEDVPGVVWRVNGAPVGTGASIQHTFTAAGTYTVSATFTDSAGNSRDSALAMVAVVAAVTATPAPAPTGDTGGTTAPTPPAPAPPTFTFVDTFSMDRMPSLVGLKVDAARDRLDRVGIEADINAVLVHQAKAPRGITIGEVMAQAPAANRMITSAIRDAEPVTLRVYAGPANKSLPTKKRCSTVNLNKALKGVDLDLAVLIAKKMACDVELDVKVGGVADPSVTGVAMKGGQIVLSANAPSKLAKNDLFLVVRESTASGNISFGMNDWALTAHQRNAFTVQVVDRAFRLVRGAKLTFDVSAAGSYENIDAQTNYYGEHTVLVNPGTGGRIDILAQLTGSDGQTIYGMAQVKVADRTSAKIGTKLATTSGRTFVKRANGWMPGAGNVLSKETATRGNRSSNRTYAGGGLGNVWSRFCFWLGGVIQGGSEDKPGAFEAKPGKTVQEALRDGIKLTGLTPGQLILGNPQVAATGLKPAEPQGGQVVSAGGNNVVSAGGGNVISAGGANVVSAGGNNVLATGSGNVISAGGANVVVASKAGVIAAGGGNVISAGGGNVVSAGGGNVISAGGGNVVAAGGMN